jgi:hypothetical protein
MDGEASHGKHVGVALGRTAAAMSARVRIRVFMGDTPLVDWDYSRIGRLCRPKLDRLKVF